VANTFVAGLDGRLRLASNVTVAGIYQWTMNKSVAEVDIPHFESDTADGVTWPDHLLGVGRATGEIHGYYDTDSTNKTEGGTPGITVGATLTADFIFVKGTPFGFSNVSIRITGFQTGSNIAANQPAAFTATYRVRGSPGLAGTVS
jgi:hypothetical protein